MADSKLRLCSQGCKKCQVEGKLNSSIHYFLAVSGTFSSTQRILLSTVPPRRHNTLRLMNGTYLIKEKTCFYQYEALN